MPSVQVLKVAHHGSWNGTTGAWAARTRPRVAVISVGADNQYGHPSAEVVLLWMGTGAQVYRTDRDGTVEVDAHPDGKFTVKTGALRIPSASTGQRPTLVTRLARKRRKGCRSARAAGSARLERRAGIRASAERTSVIGRRGALAMAGLNSDCRSIHRPWERKWIRFALLIDECAAMSVPPPMHQPYD